MTDFKTALKTLFGTPGVEKPQAPMVPPPPQAPLKPTISPGVSAVAQSMIWGGAPITQNQAKAPNAKMVGIGTAPASAQGEGWGRTQ